MKFTLSLLSLAVLSQTAFAETESDYFLTLEGGAEYTSQLSVEEIDQYDSSGDTGRYLSLDAGGEWTIAENLNLQAGYNLSDTTYQDNEAFDLTIARLYGDVSYDFSGFTLGANAHDIDAKLGGDSFMDMERRGFYASKLFNNQVFVRAEAISVDKTFDDFPERNATADAISVDSYFFYNQGKSYFSVGYETDEEKANSPEFSYDGTTYRAALSNKLGATDAHTLKLQWRYNDRDYQDIFPGLNNNRNDSRNTLRLTWDYAFNEQFILVTELENVQASSNLESADYTANQARLLLKVEL